LSTLGLMVFWSLLGQPKFVGLTRRGGYRVSHGSTLKMTSRTRLYGVYRC